MHRLGIGKGAHLKGLYPIEEGAGGIGIIGVLIAHGTRRAGGIPLLAAGDTGVTADTDIEIDHQGQLCHL